MNINLNSSIALRRSGGRTRKGFSPCREYTQESIHLINAALEAGASNVNDALERINKGVCKASVTRILNEKAELELCYRKTLYTLAQLREVKGRSKMNSAQLIVGILRSKYNPLNVEAALRQH